MHAHLRRSMNRTSNIWAQSAYLPLIWIFYQFLHSAVIGTYSLHFPRILRGEHFLLSLFFDIIFQHVVLLVDLSLFLFWPSLTELVGPISLQPSYLILFPADLFLLIEYLLEAMVLVVSWVELLVLIPSEVVDDMFGYLVTVVILDDFKIDLLSDKLFVGVNLLVEDLVLDFTPDDICHQIFCSVCFWRFFLQEA